jgi:uncharacterized protein (TIGR03435 family)
MDQLAAVLMRYVGAAVYNQTGLDGAFDVSAEFASGTPFHDLCSSSTGPAFGCLPATSQATAALPYPPARLTDSSTDWTALATQAARSAASSETVFDVIQKQLGLKLESTKGPGDVVVIDRAERPIGD